ncbi:cytochrome c oxidase assembly protein COX20, mitochondrial [Callorhinchus milii]|uniref:Cytochrome c oxidase assembly protein COX20, mitochondrial n=1 Tax=Callorhinchus milii TaxID=7868 RepID=V9LCW1_CALMI|nr:cytochrome c oxidase assembly protein COX20, mitochondrial [Callorhinchus milii]|eukprot:gi/632961131/ref/XP_007896587.1/ PREDICTED: cytochrome c oxidase protein 20 homolog [Callorhinchus milii]
MATESDGEKPKSFKLLGILDVQNTPCARESVLYGSAGAIAVGLSHFLVTSRVKRSFDFGIGGFLLTTMGTWTYCRYQNAKLRIQQRMVQEGMRNKVMFEGTKMDPNRKLESSSRNDQEDNS